MYRRLFTFSFFSCLSQSIRLRDGVFSATRSQLNITAIIFAREKIEQSVSRFVISKIFSREFFGSSIDFSLLYSQPASIVSRFPIEVREVMYVFRFQDESRR